MLARPAQLQRVTRALQTPPYAILTFRAGFVAFELLALEHAGKQAEGRSQGLGTRRDLHC